MKKIGAIVKGKYYSLTSEQKELLINWRELKAQKKKLAKKKKESKYKTGFNQRKHRAYREKTS